ncbi:unnamed protein product [Nyctereutes procyonoides]|uniref:(raccoon dog) hypothetical protein n=1 Tax=Nyctereutes procyonoides TaxID=34880 RepID=A0A811Y9C7_NYCPR|nr:unnamed protein product [Nyctereutes procyonoides]
MNKGKPSLIAIDSSKNKRPWDHDLSLRQMLNQMCHPGSSGVVKRPVNALKNLQVECAQIEAKFYEEITNAIYEPMEEECEWKPDEEDKISEEKRMKKKKTHKGIPEFWLTEHEEPILKNLKDITVKFSDAAQPISFVLEFHFEPNEYFTNEVLTKTYRMTSEPDDSGPFSFNGPEIMGKNATLKTIKKKQKHKERGTVCTVTKTIGDLDAAAEAILAADFEIGHFLHDQERERSSLCTCVLGEDQKKREFEADSTPSSEGTVPKSCMQ